jgi:hypothetical protein
MAEYRTLHTKIWQDEWFCELEPDAKVLFIYLITNPSASVAGIYRKPIKFIAFESGLTSKRVETLLAQFRKDGKAYYEDGVIWIKKLRAYQTYQGTASDKVDKRIAKDLADIPDGRLKREYMAYQASANGSYIPYMDTIDRVSIVCRETDTDTDTDTDTETDTDDGAGAPPPESESEPAMEKSAEPLTSGQRLFLGAFGAKRFKTNIQREAVLALEKQYGTTRLKECIEWAAKRGMGLGEAIGAIEKAIPKWGQPKPANGRHAAPAAQSLSSDEVAKLNADLNKNRKGFQPAQ